MCGRVLGSDPLRIDTTAPAHRPLALGDTLFDPARCDNGDDPTARVTFSQHGFNVYGVTNAGPVHLSELENIHADLVGNVLHV